MENVSRAWTSDRQTFVLVLFLNHLSPWIWREVLIGLPSVPPSRLFSSLCFHACNSRPRDASKSFRCNNFKIPHSASFLKIFLQSNDETQASAGSICRLKTGPFFYWLRPFSLGQICCQQRLGARPAEWMCTKEEALLCQTWRPEKVRVELSGWNRIRAISCGRGACTWSWFFLLLFVLWYFFFSFAFQ